MNRKILLIIPIFVTFLFVSLYGYSSQVPDLTITLNNKKLEMIKPLYGWDTLFKNAVKDNRTPLDVAKSLDAISAKSNAILNLEFSRETENVEISLWSEKSVVLLPSAKAVGVPSENGVYVYRVVAQWKQGMATYVFKVKVE